MKKVIFAAMLFVSTSLFSQNQFSCGAYISRQLPVANGSNYYTRIDSVHVENGSSSLTNIVNLNTVLINAVDYYEGYIWAWKQYNGLSQSGSGGAKLVRIDRSGGLTYFSMSSMTQNYNAAAIDANGVYYVPEPANSGASSFIINKIDLSGGTPVLLSPITVNLPSKVTWPGGGSGDLVFKNGDLFVYLNERGLFRINTSTGSTSRTYTQASDTSRIMGSLFKDASDNANIYGYSSDPTANTNAMQNVVSINVFTGAVQDITRGGTHTTQSDGASCGTSTIFTLVLKGKVFDDQDGNTVIAPQEYGLKGPGNNGNPCATCPAVDPTYVSLADNNGIVIDSKPVNQDGTYTLYNVPGNTSGLKLKLTNTLLSTGDPLPSGFAPGNNWGVTGENNSGLNAGNGDGQPDYAMAVATTPIAGEIVQQNFGADRLPIATSVLGKMVKPVVGQIITLNGTDNLPVLQGNDAEDMPINSNLHSKNIIFNTIPINAEMYYNDVLVVPGQVIPNFDSTLLTLVATSATLLTNSISFNYTYVDIAGFASASPATYTITYLTSLPVKLQSFSAQKEAQKEEVTLQWTVSNEVNLKNYAVERSMDGIHYQTIGNIPAHTNGLSSNSYRFIDVTTSALQLSYYRLCLVDENGKLSYSSILQVNFNSNGKSKMSVIASVNTDNIKIVVKAATSGKAAINIFSANGQCLIHNNSMVVKGENILTIQKQGLNLAKGIYIADFELNGEKQVAKFAN